MYETIWNYARHSIGTNKSTYDYNINNNNNNHNNNNIPNK